MAPKKRAAKKRKATSDDKGRSKRNQTPKNTKRQQEESKVEEGVSNSQAVIIEACKQWGAFKTRAAKLQKQIKEAKPSYEVLINPEKPRRGYFEVRLGDGTVVLSLPAMKRPFPALKALVIEDVCADVLGALEG